MDRSKHALMLAAVLLAVSSSACASARDGEPEKAAAAKYEAPSGPVDAKTGASWRELTLEEQITPDELRKEQLENPKLVIFDARDENTYKAMHIQGAVLPMSLDFYKKLRDFRNKVTLEAPDQAAAMAEGMKGYAKDVPIVTYCNSDCKASAGLLLRLKNMGFTNVRAMEAGIQGWEAKGYPVTIGVPRLAMEQRRPDPNHSQHDGHQH